MRYHISCHICKKESNPQFIVNVSPNNKGIYDVKCPKGHDLKIDILSHHFQTLFENAIHALSDKYFIESFVSFAAAHERFMEYFIRTVFISRGIKDTDFIDAWKG